MISRRSILKGIAALPVVGIAAKVGFDASGEEVAVEPETEATDIVHVPVEESTDVAVGDMWLNTETHDIAVWGGDGKWHSLIPETKLAIPDRPLFGEV